MIAPAPIITIPNVPAIRVTHYAPGSEFGTPGEPVVDVVLVRTNKLVRVVWRHWT